MKRRAGERGRMREEERINEGKEGDEEKGDRKRRPFKQGNIKPEEKKGTRVIL